MIRKIVVLLFVLFLTNTSRAQTAEVLCASVEFKCKNCSQTNKDIYFKKVVKMIEGDQKRLEEQAMLRPGTYSLISHEKISCNNTNFKSCELIKDREYDCVIKLDYNGLDFNLFATKHDEIKAIIFLVNMIKDCKQ